MAARVTAGVGVGLGEREGLERVGQEGGTSQSARRTAPKGLGRLSKVSLPFCLQLGGPDTRDLGKFITFSMVLEGAIWRDLN